MMKSILNGNRVRLSQLTKPIADVRLESGLACLSYAPGYDLFAEELCEHLSFQEGPCGSTESVA